METDLTEFRQANTRQGDRCKGRRHIDGLTDQERAKLVVAMGDDGIQSTAIARVLSTWVGERVSRDWIKRHRIGECVTCRESPWTA